MNPTTKGSKSSGPGIMIESSKPGIFDKLYFCFFLLLPFVYSYRLIDPVLLPRQLFLTLFVFITGLIICYQIKVKKINGDFSFLHLSVVLFLLLFVVICLLSFFQSKAISESLYFLSKTVIEVIFFLITTWLFIQNKLNLKYILRSVVLFGILSVAIAFFQLMELSSSESKFFANMLQLNSTFGHKNLLASVLFLTFPFVVISIVTEKLYKAVLVVFTLVILILTWLIQTKAVVVAFVVFFFVLLFLFACNRLVGRRIILTVSVSFFVLLGLIAGITFLNKQQFSRIFDKKSTFERLSIWKNSGEMIKENFVFGVGAGNWQVHFPKYGLDKFAVPEVKNGITTFQRPHNDYLWVFCETGIFGLLAYISVFIVIIYYLFRLFRNVREPVFIWMYAVFFASIIGYLLIALVDFPLERIEHQVLLYLLFSVITAQYHIGHRNAAASQKMAVKLTQLVFLFIITVLFSFAVALKRSSGEYHTKWLYYFQDRSDWDQMINEADKAVNFCYSMDPMSTPIQWYKGVALFSLGNIAAAKACFEETYVVHTYNIHVLNNLGSCYEVLKDHRKAVEFYRKALAVSSEFEEARLNLSAVYNNLKEYDQAFRTIDKCSISSTNEKYKLFLPVILTSWLELQLRKETDVKAINLITSLQMDKEKMTRLYFESKVKGVNFNEYILQTNQ